jgi:hypothetical protein
MTQMAVATHVWADLLTFWSKSSSIVGNCINLLWHSREVPVSRVRAVPVLLTGLDEVIRSEIAGDEGTERALFVLALTIDSEESALRVAAGGMLEFCLDRESRGAIAVLARLACVPGVPERLTVVFDWLLRNIDMRDTCVMLGMMIPGLTDEQIRACCAAMATGVMKRTPDCLLVAASFQFLSSSIDVFYDQVMERKLIVLTSTLMSIWRTEGQVIDACVAFLYEFAKAGGVNELRQKRSVLMAALGAAVTQFAEDEDITCRSVLLQMWLGRQDPGKLLSAAKTAFGTAGILGRVAELTAEVEAAAARRGSVRVVASSM